MSNLRVELSVVKNSVSVPNEDGIASVLDLVRTESEVIESWIEQRCHFHKGCWKWKPSFHLCFKHFDDLHNLVRRKGAGVYVCERSSIKLSCVTKGHTSGKVVYF